MSLFDQIDADAQAAISQVYGDPIRIRPMRGVDPNYGGGPDPDRPVVETIATFSSAPASATTDYPNTRRDGAAVSTGPRELWIDRARIAAVGYALKRGDVIELLNGSSPPKRSIIASAEPGDHGDLRVVLAG